MPAEDLGRLGELRRRLEQKYGTAAVWRGGLKIYTTLDLAVPRNAEKVMEKALADFDAKAQVEHDKKLKELTATGEPLPPEVEGCTMCGECVEACPTEARQMVGRDMTVGEVMAAVLQDGVFYEESSGGVTFSGGEPLTQPAFLKGLLEACQARGIRTAVDTCGFACTDALLETARLTDLILFDLKLMDDAKHRQYTGVSNAPILANLKALDQIHKNIWVRVPLIPGINDDDANLGAVARFAASLLGVTQISVLPYHKISVQKFRRLGRAFPLEDLEPPSPAQVAFALGKFHDFGLPASAGA